jgi:uncharacterized protein (UPF0333 family)
MVIGCCKMTGLHQDLIVGALNNIYVCVYKINFKKEINKKCKTNLFVESAGKTS